MSIIRFILTELAFEGTSRPDWNQIHGPHAGSPYSSRRIPSFLSLLRSGAFAHLFHQILQRGLFRGMTSDGPTIPRLLTIDIMRGAVTFPDRRNVSERRTMRARWKDRDREEVRMVPAGTGSPRRDAVPATPPRTHARTGSRRHGDDNRGNPPARR